MCDKVSVLGVGWLGLSGRGKCCGCRDGDVMCEIGKEDSRVGDRCWGWEENVSLEVRNAAGEEGRRRCGGGDGICQCRCNPNM